MKFNLEQTPEFNRWFNKATVKTYRHRFLSRFQRMRNGNLGDHKQISGQLFELRFFFGPGFRVYYTFKDNSIILLLIGGDKSSQSNDIKKATQLIDDLE